MSPSHALVAATATNLILLKYLNTMHSSGAPAHRQQGLREWLKSL